MDMTQLLVFRAVLFFQLDVPKRLAKSLKNTCEGINLLARPITVLAASVYCIFYLF